MILEKENYYKVMHMINPYNEFYPLLIPTINRDIDSTICTDKYLSWALIINRLNWIYLIGYVKDIEKIINVIDLIIKNRKNKNYLWWGLDVKTEGIIGKNYTVNIKSYPRYKWRFDKNVFYQMQKIESNYEIKRINEDNVNKLFINEHNPIVNFWDNIEMFLEKGFGFFIEVDNKIISVIHSAGISNNEAEIDILTDEKYRNKGLGKTLIKRFIEECLTRSITPKWDCSVSNEGSIALAKKFGFVIEREYPLKQIIFGD